MQIPPVDCQLNPLLLSNGMPICEECPPNCQACKQKISKNTMIRTSFYLSPPPLFPKEINAIDL